MNRSTVWNGYTVYGDSSELDKIIATPNIISLDKNDIIGVLSYDGEHRIVTGEGVDCRSALNAAIASLPFSLEKVTAMAIYIACNSSSPLLMNEVGALIEPLNADCDVIWGVSENCDIEQPRKIVLLVSAND